MADLQLLVAVSVRPWADALHRFCEDHGGARVRGRVIDEQAVLSQEAQVLLLDDTASFLTGRLVARARERGLAVVVVVDATQFDSVAEWVGRLGVDAVVPDDEPPERLVAVAASVAGPSSAPPIEHEDPTRRHPVVGVAGASGGVGATEVALVLAEQLTDAALLDLDLTSPSLAQRLGLPVHPNVRSAADAYRAGTSVGAHLTEVGGLQVLCGPATSGDWTGVDPIEVVGVVDQIAEFRPVVVNLPAGPPWAHPHGAVTSADISRALLGGVGTCVLVTTASPVGVTRTLEWLSAADAIPDRTHLAVNRTPASMFRRRETRLELEQALELPVWLLPEDPSVAKAAWAGTFLSGGRFRRAARRMAAAVAA